MLSNFGKIGLLFYFIIRPHFFVFEPFVRSFDDLAELDEERRRVADDLLVLRDVHRLHLASRPPILSIFFAIPTADANGGGETSKCGLELTARGAAIDILEK